MSDKFKDINFEDLKKFEIPSNQIGVYILIKNNKPVYVGKSTNIHYRLSQHYNDNSKDFDSYSLISCEDSQLDDFEKFYIMKFQPKHNKIVPDFVKIETFIARVKRFTENKVGKANTRSAVRALNIPIFNFKGVELIESANDGRVAHMIDCKLSGVQYFEKNFYVCRSSNFGE